MSKLGKKPWAPLQKGDVVDIIAPGFATTDEKLAAGVQFLKNIGLNPRVPKNLFGDDTVCGNTDAIRLTHLKNAFYAKDSKAIWCVRAGYGSIRLIEEFSKLKRPSQNKLFIGYSDACTIHNFLNQIWDFSSLHGPLLDRLGQNELPVEQVNELKKIIFGEQNEIQFKNLKPLNKAAQMKRVVKGSLAGGNLAVTQSHLGTKFSRTPKGQILFFEDIGERGYKVDKMLKQLEMAGYFKGVKAVVFGEFTCAEEPIRNAGDKADSRVPVVLKRFSENIKIPVFDGVNVGHGMNQRALPLGMIAELKCGAPGELKIRVPAKFK